jgi:CheY-like chemotaxis protein
VRIFLPRTFEQTGSDTARRARSAVPGGTEGVLVVEDNEFVRETVVEQLRSLGYRVSEAETGDAALVLLEAQPEAFDLVLTDLIMPGTVDGVALARLVGERWPSVRLLLTSGFADASLDEGGAEGEGFAVLRKPYRKAELAYAVRGALQKSA